MVNHLCWTEPLLPDLDVFVKEIPYLFQGLAVGLCDHNLRVDCLDDWCVFSGQFDALLIV